MRDYGKVSPQFWVGRTGKALRGNVEAQIVALYLMTSPHANMIGVFHCPIAYIAHETGLPIEGASKGLQSLIEADFCTYDTDLEMVFVHEFASHQVGESLDPNDKRCKGVENELAKVPKGQCWQAFRARYAVPYNLPNLVPAPSPIEAPSEPLGSQKQEQKQEQKKRRPKAVAIPLPENFGISDRVKAWAEEHGHVNLEAQLEALVSYAKRKAVTYADWDEALMNAVRNDWAKVGGSAKAPAFEGAV